MTIAAAVDDAARRAELPAPSGVCVRLDGDVELSWRPADRPAGYTARLREALADAGLAVRGECADGDIRVLTVGWRR